MQEETQQFINKHERVVKKSSIKKTLLLLVSYAIVALIVWQVQARFANSAERQQELAREEVQEVVDQVKEIMILPENEFPQMATIDNAVELAKTQAFFSSVQNGDKVLIYIQDQKAIVYRPSTGKIVNVGPVVADNSQADTQSQSRVQSQTQVQTQAQTQQTSSKPATSSKNTSTDTDEE